MSVPERFWSKVELAGPDDCWEWTAARHIRGYGIFGITARLNWLAHRYSFCQAYGPIPPGLELHHECGNPSCVNPRHLRPLTRYDHMQHHPEGYNSVKTHCPSGHPYDGGNLYLNPRGHRFCRECRREHRRAYKARQRSSRMQMTGEA